MIAVSYNNDYRKTVRKGDTLRLLVQKPDGETWTGNVTIRTSLDASPTADVILTVYDGERVQETSWDLVNLFDTSTLIENTDYLAVAELVNGIKKTEDMTKFTVLPEGRA